MMRALEKTLFPILTKLGEARHLRAIRDGIVAVLPLIITGSFFLLLAQLPGSGDEASWGPVEGYLQNAAWSHTAFAWYAAHHAIFLTPYLLTMKLMALFVAFTVSAALADSYGLDSVASGILSLSCMFVTVLPQNFGGQWFIPIQDLGGQGLFLAIILAIFCAEIYRIWEKGQWLKLPDGVPPAVVRAFSSVVPMSILVTFFWIIRDLLGVNLQGWVQVVFQPIEKLGDTLVAVILINLVIHLIWVAGIHGVSVMNAIFLSLWLDYLEQNAHAVAVSAPLPYITAHPFYQWFVWIGGSGATLGLVFLLLSSKAKNLRSIGKLAFLPSICNINEPIIFGLPIVLNPIMAIPFILAPTTVGVISYLAMKFDFVHKPFILVPWTLPGPLGAFLSTGYDWRALVLWGINFAIITIFYYPFFKMMERKVAHDADGK